VSDELNAMWANALSVLYNELSGPSFDAWLRPSSPVAFSDGTLLVQVPHEFARDWLETRHSALLSEIITSLAGRSVTVKFVAKATTGASSQTENVPVTSFPLSQPSSTSTGVLVSSGKYESAERTVPTAQFAHTQALGPAQPLSGQAGRTQATFATQMDDSREPDDFKQAVLNPKYTFDSFVVGASNRMAHAAALAVSEGPGRTYNPLFLYGGVGLGKTHLMQAIGHQFLAFNPSARVVYVPCEQFTNELILSIRFETTDAFREKYRNVDILMIDDIQFLAGKERTQEEFFHTFNTLYEAGKQIVISSDRPPREIATLESRLRSRFEWGLSADISPPELETRMAILNKKAAAENLVLPQDVYLFIAQQIQSNIRELEGALIRVTAYASLNNRELSVDVAAEAIRDMMPSSRPKQISVEMIQRAVADYYHIQVSEMRARTRVRMVSLPRQVAMFLCRELTELSLPRIGEEFGGRDHTTVIHACEKILQDRQTDPTLDANVKEIIERLKKA
jgi:chromosomal replication initiator protein